jgi:hypothetical protein
VHETREVQNEGDEEWKAREAAEVSDRAVGAGRTQKACRKRKKRVNWATRRGCAWLLVDGSEVGNGQAEGESREKEHSKRGADQG